MSKESGFLLWTKDEEGVVQELHGRDDSGLELGRILAKRWKRVDKETKLK